MLDQNDVHGNQLNSNLTISPTIDFGFPKAQYVHWSRNGWPLDPADYPRVTVSSGGALTVTDVQASDSGVYTVTVYSLAVPDGVVATVNVSIFSK